jgi:hypothetical protein
MTPLYYKVSTILETVKDGRKKFKVMKLKVWVDIKPGLRLLYDGMILGDCIKKATVDIREFKIEQMKRELKKMFKASEWSKFFFVCDHPMGDAWWRPGPFQNDGDDL